jgi:predicted PolB exonuclease-like 3'-5' exonuclease
MRETILAFDIETIPDLEGGRRLYNLQALTDDEVAAAMASMRQQARGTDFQPVHLHRIVAISVVLRNPEGLKVLSLGEESSTEAELIKKFFDGVERYKPTLVSWNGGGFDLPVINYRALVNGITGKRYWDCGYFDRDTKWNSYLKRYEYQHTDMMDVLAMYQPRNNAPLHEVAVLLGLPGKLGMDGSQVYAAWRDKRLAEIRAYCEIDVVNTYLIYLRFQLMRGHLLADDYAAEVAVVRNFLSASALKHFAEYHSLWK